MDKKDCEFMDEISADDLYDEHMRADPFTQSRQDVTIFAPEESAFINGFIDKEKLMESTNPHGKSPYGEHLEAVAEGRPLVPVTVKKV